MHPVLSLISTLLSLSSILFLLVTTIFRSKREYISYGIRVGEICHRCKEDTGIVWDWTTTKCERMCKSCERDIKLGSVLNQKKKSINYRSKKIANLGVILTVSSVPFNIITLWIKPLGIIGNICLFAGIYISYRNYLCNSRKLKK